MLDTCDVRVFFELFSMLSTKFGTKPADQTEMLLHLSPRSLDTLKDALYLILCRALAEHDDVVFHRRCQRGHQTQKEDCSTEHKRSPLLWRVEFAYESDSQRNTVFTGDIFPVYPHSTVVYRTSWVYIDIAPEGADDRLAHGRATSDERRHGDADRHTHRPLA